MTRKLKLILSGGMALVILSGVWFVYNTISERNALLQEVEKYKSDIEACVRDQEQLKDTIEDYSKVVKEQQEKQEQLEQRTENLREEREQRERELEEVLSEVDTDDVGEDCEQNINWLREKAMDFNK